MKKTVKHRVNELLSSLPDKGKGLVDRAVEYSRELRKSKATDHHIFNIDHALDIAKIIKDLNHDTCSIIAGLFHDLGDDKAVIKDIRNRFGDEIAGLVTGYTKINGLTHRTQISDNSDEYIRMVLTVAEDVRIVLIFIVNRYFKITRYKEIHSIDKYVLANRIMSFYAPLAHRLGLGKFKVDMENTAFTILEPKIAEELSRKISERRYQRERALNQIVMKLKYQLDKYELSTQIDGRTKLFPNRDTLFRTAVELLDARTRDRQKKGPCHGTATAPPG